MLFDIVSKCKELKISVNCVDLYHITLNIQGGETTLQSSLFLSDAGAADWFSSLLFNAGQNANEVVELQLSSLGPLRYIQIDT